MTYICYAKRVDQIILFKCRDLDQTHLFFISVQAIRFGIDGDGRLLIQAVEEFIEGTGVLY